MLKYNPMNIETYIKRAGSVANLAEALGISRMAVYHWRHGSNAISLENIKKLQKLVRHGAPQKKVAKKARGRPKSRRG